MLYTSTRNKNVSVEGSFAITKGISEEGGLFVPQSFPQINSSGIEKLAGMSYERRAREILSLYLTDFTHYEITACTKGAYNSGRFSTEKIAPAVKYHDDAYILELFRGPTCAFKDMALQLLPYLLTVSSKKAAAGREIVILVATSGDTGKAALEGFRDVDGTKMVVFYPSQGVSAMQKLQMITQKGSNVFVSGIRGNFDDAQSGVKKIFTDKKTADKLLSHNMMFSSANSINWGRLVPQIVYYFSAYCDMIEAGSIKNGDRINICVPTGNFGDILAAYYAYKMGLPVNKFICASNANNVLTDFIKTGVYDRNRDFYTTYSPSMDILISSNLERLLFDLYENDDEAVKKLMDELARDGKYTIRADVKDRLSSLFECGYCDDEGTLGSIHDSYEKYGYLPDTHTAVALRVYEDYVKRTEDKTPAVICATASPYKFPKAVFQAVTGKDAGCDDTKAAEELEKLTGIPIPEPLKGLSGKEVRFPDVCDISAMEDTVFKMLGIG